MKRPPPTAALPFNDLERIHAPLRTEFERALRRVLEHGRFVLGPEVEAFEHALASSCGSAFAVGVSSGTDALTAALAALGVGPGDEVVAPAFSYVASASAVRPLGARVVFCDIDPDTFGLCPVDLERRLGPRTRAVVMAHLFGQIGRIDEVAALAAEAGAALVEDAAQSIGARDARGRRAGTVGALGCLSFFPAKNLGALGDGGAVLTDDATLAERLRRLRQHGGHPKYHYEEWGGNWRLDALQAALLSVKLPHLPAWTQARGAAAARYAEALGPLAASGALTLPLAGAGQSAHNQFTVRLPRRDAVRRALAARGVPTMVYYPEPLHLQPCFAELGHGPGDFPHAERACAEVLSLPLFPGITEAEQDRVVRALVEAVSDGEGRG